MSESLPVPVISTADGSVRYQCTAEDLVMLARAVRKESRTDAAYLCWCYAQRLVMLHQRGNRLSMKKLIEAHSQPVNVPVWGPSGTKCRPGGAYHGRPECANAAQRVANASYPWERIEEDVKDAVRSFGGARLPNPCPRATDFAAEWLVDRKIAGENPRGFVMVRRGQAPVTNSFVSEPDSRAWPSDDYVRVTYNGRTASAGGLPKGAKIALGVSAGLVVIVAAAWAAGGVS